MARLAEAETWARLASGRRASLAVATEHGAIFQVPIVYAPIRRDQIVTAVDSKPKSSRELARLRHIRANPSVSLLVDHYEEDWSELWWVRVEGRAGIHASVDARIEHTLRARYPQYADHELGPWIVVTPERVVGWAAS